MTKGRARKLKKGNDQLDEDEQSFCTKIRNFCSNVFECVYYMLINIVNFKRNASVIWIFVRCMPFGRKQGNIEKDKKITEKEPECLKQSKKNQRKKEQDKEKGKEHASLKQSKKKQKNKEQDPEKENTPHKESPRQELEQEEKQHKGRSDEIQQFECEKEKCKERLKEAQKMLENERKKNEDSNKTQKKNEQDKRKDNKSLNEKKSQSKKEQDPKKENTPLKERIQQADSDLQQQKDDLPARLKELQKLLECEKQTSKERLENERKKSEDRLKKFEETNHRLKQENADTSDRLKEAQKMLENERKKNEDRCAELQNEISKIKAEKKDALNRLSALMGERLRDNNPAITNLNDPNRPMKLGDQFSELYENEWTDAYSDLEAKNNLDERQAINTLLDILKEIYHICTLEVKENMKKVAGNANNVEDKSLSRLKSSLKSNAGSDIEQLLMEITNSGENKTVQTYKDTCLPFIQKCVKICYYAELQDPPMFINFEPGEYFDRQYFKEYTKSGTMVGYLVWPAFHLHKDGPLMTKGVVQPKE